MDLRTFIDRLAAAGRLRRVEQLTDWKLDIGKLIREEHVPLLFENIKDYPGARVFSKLFAPTAKLNCFSRKVGDHRNCKSV